MITPAIVLAILLVPLALFTWLGNTAKGGIIGLVLAFTFFGIGHFAQTEAMIAMLPEFVPAKRAMIYLTGILEFILAVGIAWPRSRRIAGIGCLLILVGFFPANVYAAFNEVGPGGHQWGPEYLLIRVPLQALLIWWTWRFAVRRGRVQEGDGLF